MQTADFTIFTRVLHNEDPLSQPPKTERQKIQRDKTVKKAKKKTNCSEKFLRYTIVRIYSDFSSIVLQNGEGIIEMTADVSNLTWFHEAHVGIY